MDNPLEEFLRQATHAQEWKVEEQFWKNVDAQKIEHHPLYTFRHKHGRKKYHVWGSNTIWTPCPYSNLLKNRCGKYPDEISFDWQKTWLDIASFLPQPEDLD